MAELTNHQLGQITKWIQSLDINYYDVELELVDHIASGVEEELDNNSTRQTVDLLVSEIKKWPYHKIDALIKEKKHHLYWGWNKKIWSYLVSYFKLPKILILLALTSCFGMILINIEQANTFVDICRQITTLFYLLWLAHAGFMKYKKENRDLTLISTEAYYKTVGGLPVIPYLIFDVFGNFNSADLPISHVALFSFLISICIIFLHAFFIVFPKQLKEDTLAYYEHLKLN